MAKRLLVDYSSSGSDDEAEKVDSDSSKRRVRAVPHTEGNWATLVSIKIAAEADLVDSVSELIKECRHKSLTPLEASTWHLSISRTLYLKLSHIHPMVDALTKAARSINSFSVWPSGATVFPSDNGATSFLGIDVSSTDNRLLKLISAVDTVVSSFGYEKFFSPPQPHFSVAWASRIDPATLPPPSSACFEDLSEISLPVSVISIRAGNKNFAIPLAQS